MSGIGVEEFESAVIALETVFDSIARRRMEGPLE